MVIGEWWISDVAAKAVPNPGRHEKRQITPGR